MGWASGSRLFNVLITLAQKAIPDDATRVEFYKPVISAFEAADWDTQDECLGKDPAFDKALAGLHPDWD